MSDDQPKYRSAWILLVLFVLGAALALVWMLAEVKRTQRIHDASYPAAPMQTNRSAGSP